MAVTYRVRDWDRHYETAETRRLKRLRFCLVPNKHDGKSYRRLMAHPKAGDVLAAWLLILQVASKCPVRGVLADEDGPLDADDLSIKTGLSASSFTEAFSLLVDPKIGWLECVTSNSQQSPAIPSGPAEVAVQKGREGKGQEGTGIDGTGMKEGMSSGDDPPAEKPPAMTAIEAEIVEAWNGIEGVTRVVAMNPSRKNAIRVRMGDSVFRQHWRDAIEKVRGSPFCTGHNDRNWRATIDWFLKPGTVAKAIEGQYDARRKNGTASETIDDYLAQFGGQT